MATKTLPCRSHEGGKFTVPSSRGRYPVRCSDDNVCDKHPALSTKKSKVAAPSRRRRRPEPVPEVTAPRKPRPTLRAVNKAALNTGSFCRCPEMDGERHEKGVEGCKYAARKAPATVKHNPSVPLAYQAKRLLEPEGWKLSGQQWFDEENRGVATVLANRGKEIISLMWVAGKLTSQNYSMFSSDKPSLEGMPKPKLGFFPDDMSDAGLIKELSGKTVVWWNRTGGSKETAVMPSRSDQRVKIEHLMNGSGNEEKRVVSFVDQAGTGYRAFDVAHLLSVKG